MVAAEHAEEAGAHDEERHPHLQQAGGNRSSMLSLPTLTPSPVWPPEAGQQVGPSPSLTSAAYILQEGTMMRVAAVPGRLSEEPILVVTTHSCARCRSSRPARRNGIGKG